MPSAVDQPTVYVMCESCIYYEPLSHSLDEGDGRCNRLAKITTGFTYLYWLGPASERLAIDLCRHWRGEDAFIPVRAKRLHEPPRKQDVLYMGHHFGDGLICTNLHPGKFNWCACGYSWAEHQDSPERCPYPKTLKFERERRHRRRRKTKEFWAKREDREAPGKNHAKKEENSCDPS